MILKAYKYRLYPTKEQCSLIEKHITYCRFIYNLVLETKQTAYKGSLLNLTSFDLIKQLPDLKKEFTWLKEVNSQSLQESIKNLDQAYTTYFRELKNGTIEKKKKLYLNKCLTKNRKINYNFLREIGKPNFKKKNTCSLSFTVQQSIIVEDNELNIPKFKTGIKLKIHREYEGHIRQCTISKTRTGKYFVSILCGSTEILSKLNKITFENTVGIDLGIKDFYVDSNGNKKENPRFYKKSLKQLKFLQKKFSKFKSKKYKKLVAKQHEKISNTRKDFLQKLSTDVIKNHDNIALETLKVTNMIKNHNLAQAIQDVSWSSFNTMLTYEIRA
jgi:putative transposase